MTAENIVAMIQKSVAELPDDLVSIVAEVGGPEGLKLIIAALADSGETDPKACATSLLFGIYLSRKLDKKES